MRYENKISLINTDRLYYRHFIDRGVNFIEIEQVPDLVYPTGEQIAQLELISHTWKIGDKLYKLAHRNYNDSSLWWIIAFYNQKPTEAHFAVGDVLRIPLPLDKMLDFIGY